MAAEGSSLIQLSSDDDDGFEKDLTAITPDLYGATLVSTIIAVREEPIWGDLIVTWFRSFLNLFFQFGITFTVWKFINVDKMAPFYPVDTKANMYTTRLDIIMAQPGLMLNATDATDATIISLCNELPRRGFLLVVWFLWSAKIITELSASYHFAQQVLRVPLHSRLKVEDGKDGAVNVMGLTNMLRLVFLGLIVIPKVLVGVLLWWAGTQFLAMATNMGALILKIFTLQFVLTLDELLFDAFLAKQNKDRIKGSKMSNYKQAIPGWFHELAKLLGCVVFVLISHWYFLDIQEVRRTCWDCVRDCSNDCSQAFGYCG